MIITQWVIQTAELIKTREDLSKENELKPHGDCPTCGKPYRTPKDTKIFWFWLGYHAGWTALVLWLRKRKVSRIT